jgi:hypothetical protein
MKWYITFIFILINLSFALVGPVLAGSNNVFTSEQLIQNNKKYSPQRTQLALALKDILDKHKVTWFLDGGTLLGAYRNGKSIPSDDDFDMGRNPQTGAPIKIKSYNQVKFKPGIKLKESCNKTKKPKK